MSVLLPARHRLRGPAATYPHSPLKWRWPCPSELKSKTLKKKQTLPNTHLNGPSQITLLMVPAVLKVTLGKGVKCPADNLQLNERSTANLVPLALLLSNSKHNVQWFNQIYFKSIPPSRSSSRARGTWLHTSKRENDLSFSFALFLFAICSQQARPDKEASPLVRFFPYGRICSLATKQKCF